MNQTRPLPWARGAHRWTVTLIQTDAAAADTASHATLSSQNLWGETGAWRGRGLGNKPERNQKQITYETFGKVKFYGSRISGRKTSRSRLIPVIKYVYQSSINNVPPPTARNAFEMFRPRPLARGARRTFQKGNVHGMFQSAHLGPVGRGINGQGVRNHSFKVISNTVPLCQLSIKYTK